MQVAIGSVMVSSLLVSRSNAHKFYPIQRFPGHQSSQRFSLRSSRCRIRMPVVRMSPSSHAMEKVETVEGELSKVDRSSVRSWNIVGLLGSGGSFTFTCSAARAEEVVVDTSAQATEGAADTLLSFLFTAAFIGLSILTVGVLYLSVSDWLEKRERNAMTKGAGTDQDNLGAPEKEKAERLAPKGFGKKVEKAEKDKKVEQKS